MTRTSGREREANQIRKTNRAAAVGRLMLGDFDTWQEFLHADVVELTSLPRRQLRSGKIDVERRLAPEIKNFCSRNFIGMTDSKLSLLYEDIKAFRGIEIPLRDFEEKYARVKRKVLKGNPAHLTVKISLWGLQFKFPEDTLSKSLSVALDLIVQAQKELGKYRKSFHRNLTKNREEIAMWIRQSDFAAQSAVLVCFNLLEAYLNGLAWDYMQLVDVSTLSNRKRKLLEDTSTVSTRDKLRKYPSIITGNDLWDVAEKEDILNAFMDVVKPFRDSLVHPSPFSAPEKFGGYDKLRLLYRIDYDTGLLTANMLVSLIELIHFHIYGKSEKLPDWFGQLKQEVEKASKKIKNIEIA